LSEDYRKILEISRRRGKGTLKENLFALCAFTRSRFIRYGKVRSKGHRKSSKISYKGEFALSPLKDGELEGGRKTRWCCRGRGKPAKDESSLRADVTSTLGQTRAAVRREKKGGGLAKVLIKKKIGKIQNHGGRELSPGGGDRYGEGE